MKSIPAGKTGSWTLAAGLLTLTVLAGCTENVSLQLDSTIGMIWEYPGVAYGWTPPVASDAQGNLLSEHPLFADPTALPWAIQKVLGRGGSEPNVAITGKKELFVTSFDDVQRSTDGGKTWKVVYEFRTPNYPVSHDRFEDSGGSLWVDPKTDRIFQVLQDSEDFCTHLMYSVDGGNSWTERLYDYCGTPWFSGGPKLVTSPPHATLVPLSPAQAYENVVYVCLVRWVTGPSCAASYDSGATFLQDSFIRPPIDNCVPASIGQPTAYPDGTIVVPMGYWSPPLIWGIGGRCEKPPMVVVSEDNGLTWNERVFPGKAVNTEAEPDITITSDGTAYMVFRAKDQMTYLLRSKDKFATWEGPFRIGLPDHTLNVLSAITSGDNGRVAIAYLGTTTEQEMGATPARTKGDTHWHLYLATSTDAAGQSPTFITQQVTPEWDPVQVGCVIHPIGSLPQGGPQAGSFWCLNLYSYIDITHDADGRVYATITDGCVPRGGCTADTDAGWSSKERDASVIVQDRGLSLFEQKGVLSSLGLEPPVPTQPACCHVEGGTK